jgi:hypothetical protein
MSNELSIFKPGAVAAAFADNDFTKDVASNSMKRISIRGGVFRRHDGKQEIDSIDDRFLPVVVVGASPHVQREYYEGQYVEGVEAVPVCYSNDGRTPDKDAIKKQASDCASCPQNQKGSNPVNGGRACRFARRIAVVLANDIGGDIYAMKLPSMSIFGEGSNGYYPFQAYATFLRANKAPMPSVVTEMRFDKDAAVPKLLFKPLRQISEADVDIIKRQMQHDDVKRAIELRVIAKTADAELPAPVAAPAVSTPAASAKTSKPRATGAAKLSEAVESWGADSGEETA